MRRDPRPDLELPAEIQTGKRARRLRVTIGGLMIVIAIVAIGFAYPAIPIFILGNLVTTLVSSAAMIVIAAPVMLVIWLLDRTGRRRGPS